MKAMAKAAVATDSSAKRALIFSLFLVASAIIASGAFFSVYSIAQNISIHILNVDVPGFVMGLLVTYLGIRYFLLVRKLKANIYDPAAHFSWSNFKRKKTVKSR
ncbi:MAG: hypothetical protein P4L75_06955 [Clostridia bacterium]|nr:hypothetical protein [Clostridia bacterium]MDR3645884.1 hypothetical protein [Clostridia bacterium]